MLGSLTIVVFDTYQLVLRVFVASSLLALPRRYGHATGPVLRAVGLILQLVGLVATRWASAVARASLVEQDLLPEVGDGSSNLGLLWWSATGIGLIPVMLLQRVSGRLGRHVASLEGLGGLLSVEELVVDVGVWHRGVKLSCWEELVGRGEAVVGVIQKVSGVVVVRADGVEYDLGLVLDILLAARYLLRELHVRVE